MASSLCEKISLSKVLSKKTVIELRKRILCERLKYDAQGGPGFFRLFSFAGTGAS